VLAAAERRHPPSALPAGGGGWRRLGAGGPWPGLGPQACRRAASAPGGSTPIPPSSMRHVLSDAKYVCSRMYFPLCQTLLPGGLEVCCQSDSLVCFTVSFLRWLSPVC